MTDEIEALRIAIGAARARGWPWRPPYWLAFENDQWNVHAENECIIRVSAATGEVVSDAVVLDPVSALSAARSYAEANELRWAPVFTLRLELDCWEVGARQSQFGGQIHIYVSHDGNVLRHWVNPK